MRDMNGREVTVGCTIRSCAAELDGRKNGNAWTGTVEAVEEGWVKCLDERDTIPSWAIEEAYEVVA